MNIKLARPMPFLRYFEGEDGGSSGGDVSGDVSGVAGGEAPQQEATNPAWNPLLEKIPSALHPMVTPHLKEWDSNFDKKVSEVQSKYSPFDPLLEAGASPEQLTQAYELYRLMESDPQRIYNEMKAFYGYDAEDQGPAAPNSDSGFDINSGEEEVDPRIAELMRNQEAMAQVFVKQAEDQQRAAIEAELDKEIATIMEAHPDLTEEEQVTMFQLATGGNISLTKAAEQLFGLKEQYGQSALAGRSNAPQVMSASGSIPGQPPIDPRKLDSQGTRSLVADIVKRSQTQP